MLAEWINSTVTHGKTCPLQICTEKVSWFQAIAIILHVCRNWHWRFYKQATRRLQLLIFLLLVNSDGQDLLSLHRYTVSHISVSPNQEPVYDPNQSHPSSFHEDLASHLPSRKFLKLELGGGKTQLIEHLLRALITKRYISSSFFPPTTSLYWLKKCSWKRNISKKLYSNPSVCCQSTSLSTTLQMSDSPYPTRLLAKCFAHKRYLINMW